MHLTTKGKYAVTAALDLASQESKDFIAISDLASRQSIPGPYLEQLFRNLRKAGILISIEDQEAAINCQDQVAILR